MIGVDFASVDGNTVDWDAAWTAKIRFAFFRADYVTSFDPTWRNEQARAIKRGITVGPYLFPSLAVGAPSPQAQVTAFSQAIQSIGPGVMPPTLDVEFPGGIKRTGRGRGELVHVVLDFVAELRRQFGVAPIIYTSARVWDGEDEDSLDVDGSGIDVSAVAECPLWLARYAVGTRQQPITLVDNVPTPPVPKAWGDHSNVWIHQFQGDAVHLAGFSSTVDLDRFFVLRKGATGARVEWVQKRLGMPEGERGVFDDVTENAVRDFQRGYQIEPDGEIGPHTLSFLAWHNPT